MTTVRVNASKSYDVVISEGFLEDCGARITKVVGGRTAAIVTDDTVGELYGATVEDSLTEAGFTVSRFTFPQGETSKSIGTYTALLQHLTAHNLTRADAVIALGGGVVGDLAGFAAATYLRGVRFVQIPTTLLAMVDSSVGGKTAVNMSGDSDTGGGKNQVGAFYQPDLVICDYDTLTTLPEDTFNEGVAEIIKHAAIRDAELFALLESQSLYDNLEAVIARNVTIKRDVIAVDERDTGLRQILNFGHTIAHGIEKHSGYSVSHGKAVAAGMVIESRGECRARITALLQRYGLPTRTEFTRAQLVSAASADKKRAGGKITVVALTQIGECRLETIELEKMNEYYYFTM